MGFTFEQPLTAGVVLLRSAIQSPDFVTGISGWSVNQSGSAEFNNATIRGTIIAGGGAVIIDSTGVHVVGPVTTYNINVSVGFFANKTADDGSFTQIASNAVVLNPAEPTANGFAITQSAIIQTVVSTVGAIDTPHVSLFSPIINTQNPAANITLYGEASDGVEQRHISFDGYIDSGFTDRQSHEWLRGENQLFFGSLTAVASATFAITFTHAFTLAPQVNCNINSGAGSTARWVARAFNITTTGFTYFVFAADSVASTWVNVALTWAATEYTP